MWTPCTATIGGCAMNNGFTLLEVLIATAIAAVLLGSSIVLGGQYLNNVAHLEAKLAADVVARNLAGRYRLQVPPHKHAEPVAENGSQKQAGYTFNYRITPTPTATPDLTQLTIQVTQAAHSTALRELIIYVPKPVK